MENKRRLIRISTSGSVDSGKSTLIGRFLFDSQKILEDQYLSVKSVCEKKGMNLDFSYFLDGLRAERDQKITIDVAHKFFSTKKNDYIIYDVPGHEQYTKNMISGVFEADISIVIVDVSRGFLEQSKRHFFISSILKKDKIIFCINKMDLISYKEKNFLKLKEEINNFVKRMNIENVVFIPISASKGDMLKNRKSNMAWYKGETLFEALEVFGDSIKKGSGVRFPIQFIGKDKDEGRLYSGRLDSGKIALKDSLLVLPSNRRLKVNKIIRGFENVENSFCGQSISLGFEGDHDIGRGDLISGLNNKPFCSKRIRLKICWFSSKELKAGDSFIAKSNCRKTRCAIEVVESKINFNSFKVEKAESLIENDVGFVIIKTNDYLLGDSYEKNKKNGSLILIDEKNLKTSALALFDKDLGISSDSRKPESPIIWFTGLSGSGKTTMANLLQRFLKKKGFKNKVIDGDSFRKEFKNKLGFSEKDRETNVRIAAFVSKIISENGIIAICSFVSPFRAVRDDIKSSSPNLLEIFCDSSLEVCEKRDTKGLYKKARMGEIKNFTGIDQVYEKPLKPDLVLRTGEENEAKSFEKLLNFLIKFIN